jgi:NAD(P)-dependent dehydrogenase (short-subunit alcohol dehydrogenase family)
MADLGDLDLLYATIKTAATRLDVVVASAGGGTFATLEQLTPDEFDQASSSNVHGTVFTVQKALPLLNEGAAIVVTGSTSASRTTNAGPPSSRRPVDDFPVAAYASVSCAIGGVVGGTAHESPGGSAEAEDSESDAVRTGA